MTSEPVGHGLSGVWVLCVVGGTAVAAVLFLDLRRHLSDAQDGLADAGPATVDAA